MKTAIILVTYNGWEMTQNCLHDLSAQLADKKNYVVAVADNASTDGTPENIRKNFPSVHVYPCEGNLGFGRANNLAIRSLIRDGENFDAICLLNNDTRFDSQMIPQLRNALDQQIKTCKYAIVVPRVQNPDGSEQPNYFAGLGPEGIGSIPFFTNAFRNEAQAARILQGKPAYKGGYAETHWASGVCWMLGRSLYDELQKEGEFFDERIFMYYEDADLALRARKLGARFFICNKVELTHLGGGSSEGNLKRALQHDRAQQYVFKKHFGFRGYLLSKSFRFCRSLVRIAASLPRCLGKNGSRNRVYVKHHLALLKEALW